MNIQTVFDPTWDLRCSGYFIAWSLMIHFMLQSLSRLFSELSWWLRVTEWNTSNARGLASRFFINYIAWHCINLKQRITMWLHSWCIHSCGVHSAWHAMQLCRFEWLTIDLLTARPKWCLDGPLLCRAIHCIHLSIMPMQSAITIT